MFFLEEPGDVQLEHFKAPLTLGEPGPLVRPIDTSPRSVLRGHVVAERPAAVTNDESTLINHDISSCSILL